MAGGGEVHDVVQEVDHRDRAGGARLVGVRVRVLREGRPLGERRLGESRPVQRGAAGARTGGGAARACARARAGRRVGARSRRLGRVDEQDRRVRGACRLGTAQHPDLEPHMERRRRARGQRHHRAQGAAADQLHADPAARGAGGGGRGEEQDGVAARHQMGQRVLDPGELGLGARRYAVRPAGVVRQLVVAPVAVAVGRVAEDGVDDDPVERVRAETVSRTHRDVRVRGRQQQAHRTALRLHGHAVLAVQHRRAPPGGGREQGAAAACRVQDLCTRSGHQAGDEVGELHRGAVGAARGAVLQLPLRQHGQRRLAARVVLYAAQQRPQDIDVMRREVDGLRAGDQLREVGHRPVGAGDELGVGQAGQRAELLGSAPGRGQCQRKQGAGRAAAPGVQSQRGAQLLRGGGRRGVAPGAEPLLHVHQVVERAAVGAPGRRGEVVVPTAPVADGGARDSGDA